MKKIFLVCVALIALAALKVRAAEEPHGPTDVELKSLPYYCTVKRQLEKGVPGARQAGYAALGEQFGNVHHFCNGLNFINRYYRSPFGAKAGSYLASAINEFTYMVEHLVPNSSLAAESYLGRATAYALSRRDGEAMRDFQTAVRYNPRLAGAYVAWADFLVERKLREDALKVVTEGLRWNPGHRALENRYTTLGGKLPYPEPVAASGSPALPDSGGKAPEPAPAASTQSVEPEPKATTTDPDRPYCRFCPDQP